MVDPKEVQHHSRRPRPSSSLVVSQQEPTTTHRLLRPFVDRQPATQPASQPATQLTSCFESFLMASDASSVELRDPASELALEPEPEPDPDVPPPTISASDPASASAPALALDPSQTAHRLCASLERHLTNLGRSLSCAVCCSTPTPSQPAVLLAGCVHLLCRNCADRSLRFKAQCPVCRHPSTRRSMVNAPSSFAQAAYAYKKLLRDCGIAPAMHVPTLHMTQLVGGIDDFGCGDDANELEGGWEGSSDADEDEDDDDDEEETKETDTGKGDEASNTHSMYSSLVDTAVYRQYQLSVLLAQSRHTNGATSAAIREQDSVVDANRSAVKRAKAKANIKAKAKAKARRNRNVDPAVEANVGDGDATVFAEGETPQAVVPPPLLPPPNHPLPPPTQEVAAEAQGQSAADRDWEDECLWAEEQHEQQLHRQPERQEFEPSLDDDHQLLEQQSQQSHERQGPQRRLHPMEELEPCEPEERHRFQVQLPERELQQSPHAETENDHPPLPEDGGARAALRTLHENLVGNGVSDDDNRRRRIGKDPVPTLAQDTPESPGDGTREDSDDNGGGNEGGYNAAVETGRPLLDSPTARGTSAPRSALQPDASPKHLQAILHSPPSPTAKRRWVVGDVVNVAPRTWPGINKLGGVARITSVHDDLPQGPSYDVKYILGGTEAHVDACFVNPYACGTDDGNRDGEDATEADAGHHRKSGRLERHAPPGLPPDLLAQLAREGFDVSGRAAPRTNVGTTSESREAAPSRKRRLVEPLTRFVRQRVRRGGGNRESRPSPAMVGTDPVILAAEEGAFEPELNTGVAEAPASNAVGPSEWCLDADLRYHLHVSNAVRKGMVCLVTSALTKDDKAALEQLCRRTKGSPVRVKSVERFDAKNVTICLVPATVCQTGGDLMAASRTLKTMQATLAGIPMVSTAWVQQCLSSKSVAPPLPEQFVRSLPCFSADGSFGVARLASQVHRDPSYRILTGCSVHLCGSIPRPKEADILLLLKVSGATVLTHAASVVAHLNKTVQTRSGPLVLICGNGVKLSASLDTKLRETMRSTRDPSVWIVQSHWVFDCIATGHVLQPDKYEPVDGGQQARELWSIARQSFSLEKPSP